MVDKVFFPQPIMPQSGEQARKPQQPKVSFEDVLAKSQQVKFSGHAQQMIDRREIQLSPGRMERLNDAVKVAEQKGSRDSLIMVDDLALVVSIKNKTVITAVDQPHMKGKVFTNIDSAVIA